MITSLGAAALAAVGLALAFGGLLFFRRALSVLGFLLGLGFALWAANGVDSAAGYAIVLLIVGPMIGLMLGPILRFWLVVAVGAGAGWLAATAVLGSKQAVTPANEVAVLTAGVMVGLGVLVAYRFETAVFALVSAAWGSLLVALAAGGVTAESAVAPAVLIGEYGALRGSVFLLGIGTQAGLWLYLRRALDDGEDARAVVQRAVRQLVESVDNRPESLGAIDSIRQQRTGTDGESRRSGDEDGQFDGWRSRVNPPPERPSQRQSRDGPAKGGSDGRRRDDDSDRRKTGR